MSNSADGVLTGSEIEQIESDPVLSVEDVLNHRENADE